MNARHSLLWALLLVLPAAAAVAADQTNRSGAPQGDAEAGHKIVMEGTEAGAAPCSSCHQENGAGNPEAKAPRIAGQPAFYLEKQLRDYAGGARRNEVMGPIAQALSDADKANVAAYFAQASAPLPKPAGNKNAEQAGHGRTLATVGVQEKGVEACANCHGPLGAGLPPSYPALAGQQADYIKAQLQAWQQGTRKNDEADVMKYIAHRLDPQDIDAVAQFFANARPDLTKGPAGAVPQVADDPQNARRRP